MNIENSQAQMKKGVLEYCILSVIARKDCYVSEIIHELKEARMIVVEGTLYPLLTRQKNAGLLSYRWEESRQGPPRKYYTLTDEGKKYLQSLDESWKELVNAVDWINKRRTSHQ